jgi:hypothetical protein
MKKIILIFFTIFLVFFKLNNSFAILPEESFSSIKTDTFYYEKLKALLVWKNNQTQITKKEFIAFALEISWKSCVTSDSDPYQNCVKMAMEKWYITSEPTNDEKILVNDALKLITFPYWLTPEYTYKYVNPQNWKEENYKLYAAGNNAIPNRNLNVGDLTRMAFIFWDISKTYFSVWPINENNKCDADDDNDGVKNCDDICKTVYWIPLNNWCPMLEQRCKADCSCDDWFICSNTTSWVCGVKWVCLPKKDLPKDTCLYDWYSAILYWNSICDSCPCANTLNFNSDFRKCDLLFSAITSPNWKEIYSQGSYYQIK